MFPFYTQISVVFVLVHGPSPGREILGSVLGYVGLPCAQSHPGTAEPRRSWHAECSGVPVTPDGGGSPDFSVQGSEPACPSSPGSRNLSADASELQTAEAE